MGYAIIHYSNTKILAGEWCEQLGWRNNFNMEDIRTIVKESDKIRLIE